ncbi:MAG: elongation factor P lysine(34) lysyltransferase [Chlamydiia bacterium]|nr:elongation factor P lysine(34) lysyltransferase [Chlamydiia bacterium]
MSLASKSSALKARGEALKKVRTFFEERAVLEVDTPLLSKYAPIDVHIDLFEVHFSENEKGYLHSSPEYGMKKLLANDSGDIYQLSHVFRKDEIGRLHRPEFTMIEWYRTETTFEAFIEENLALLSLFLGPLPYEIVPYKEAFARYGNKYPSDDPNITWGCAVEPHLGNEKITIITDYPKEQAALAQTKWVDGVEVAERFEFYYQGIELGNGYHELTDPVEQKNRLLQANQERIALGKPPLPYDEELIAALEKGLPDCYGIALGFDRLFMLQQKHSSL